MSLHTVANHMAAKGRGPDTQLVHMSNREVAGLQALAKAQGGSLTINPHTGLVEAGFLDRMLPTILGAGLMFATGGAGAAVLSPELIGLGVGGLQTARTGSLSQGLMAGLGAYGGAGLASGFGAGAAEAAPTPAPVEAAPTPAPVAEAPITQASPETLGMERPIGADYEQLSSQQQMAIDNNRGFGNAPFEPRPGVVQSNYGANFSAGPTQTSLAPAPATPASSGIGTLSPKDAFKYGAASLGSMADTKPKATPLPEKYTGPLSRYSMSESYKPYDAQQPDPYYQAQYKTYAAGGGVVEQMSNANAIGQNTGFPMANLQGPAYATPWQTPMSTNMVSDAADTGVNRMTGEMSFAGGGGISSLGGYSDGGRMLKGPGDGMSDSIPAQIGGKQPARLADGEFVVPADVVSHLGNGSSDAGAKQLYKMMDRIRQQRTGKKKQAPQVNTSKAMPA